MREPNPAPVFVTMYPGLCDKARELGYALAVHGSVVTDFDLVAIPWTEDASDPVTLKDALMEHVGACGYEELLRRTGVPEEHAKQIAANELSEDSGTPKPHGRVAWNLYLGNGLKIDLSVIPRT